MIVQTRIEPEILEKIRKLIDDKHYTSIHDFVGLAIENQIQLDLSENELLPMNDAILFSEVKPAMKKPITFIGLDDFDIPKIQVKSANEIKTDRDIQFEVYGPGASGLIWIFQNRFFPVKVALQSLSKLISSEQSDFVEFDLWKTSAAEFALDVASKLYRTDNKNEVNIGLPSAKQKIESKFSKKRNKEILITQKLEASKKRFAEQFVGRIIQKDSKKDKIVFSGACFEMGLVTLQEDFGDPLNPKISLTKEGLEFLKLQNPVFEMLKRDDLNTSKNVFSNEERQFIKKNIISRFSLEEQIIDYILGLGKQKISNNIIKKKFLEFKGSYTKRIFKDEKALGSLIRKYEEKIKADYECVDNETTIGWIVNRYLEFQIIATIGRLIELNLIRREYEGREPVYYIK